MRELRKHGKSCRLQVGLRRNGSAADSRSGWEFESLWLHFRDVLHGWHSRQAAATLDACRHSHLLRACAGRRTPPQLYHAFAYYCQRVLQLVGMFVSFLLQSISIKMPGRRREYIIRWPTHARAGHSSHAPAPPRCRYDLEPNVSQRNCRHVRIRRKWPKLVNVGSILRNETSPTMR